MTDFYNKKVTIYNDINADGVNPRRFDRFVIDKCLIYNQATEGSDGTISRIIDTQNIITKDVKRYKTPIEYKRLPIDQKELYYTAQINDFVVLLEVDDVVTTSKEFQELQKKYKDSGFLVTAVNASVFGMGTDNVHIMHA